MATGRVPTTANSPLTAKGDLFTYSTAPARLAVGLDGEQIVADSSTSTGLRYQGNYAAGKNVIINGDFNVWQRGTSFTNTNGAYTADRFKIETAGTPTTMTTTRQTFTPGTAPVAGYEGVYFFRNTITTLGSLTACDIKQPIENVQTFAGQTVTISFWAKADSARTVTSYVAQIFGSGGSSPVDVNPSGNSFSMTTAWARFSYTLSIPSISGKTIGTSSYLQLQFRQAAAAGSVIDIWGVQVEAGSVATAFQTATGTLQGELAACQRYYERATAATSFENFATGFAVSATMLRSTAYFKVTKRAAVTSVDFSTLRNSYSQTAITAVSFDAAGINSATINCTTTGLSTNLFTTLLADNSTNAFLGFSAEL